MSKQEILVKKTEKTPNYDKISNNVKKLLTATAATYIPELCDALRKDWFPRATNSTFAREENKPVRDEIRERILDDWSNQRNWSDSPWGDDSIRQWFPDWLKNPAMIEPNKINSAKGNAAKKYKQILGSLSPKIFNEKTIDQLPEVPKQLLTEHEEEEEEGGPTQWGSGTIVEPTEKYTPTPEKLYEDAIHGLAKAWSALTNADHIPGIAEDVFLDYIKPSDKHRLRILKGLDEGSATHLINVLVYTHMVIKRTVQAWNDMQKENTKKIVIE